jgi:ubiquitin
VTDQGSGSDFSSDNVPSPESNAQKSEEQHTVTYHRTVYAFVQRKPEQVFCIVCGQQGSFIKPFDRWG